MNHLKKQYSHMNKRNFLQKGPTLQSQSGAIAAVYFKYIFFTNDRKYQFFIQFVDSLTIVFMVKSSLKNIGSNMFFIFLKFQNNHSVISCYSTDRRKLKVCDDLGPHISYYMCFINRKIILSHVLSSVSILRNILLQF